jgi:hypothetical protein
MSNSIVATIPPLAGIDWDLLFFAPKMLPRLLKKKIASGKNAITNRNNISGKTFGDVENVRKSRKDRKYGREGPKAVFSPKHPTVPTRILARSWIRQQELAKRESPSVDIHGASSTLDKFVNIDFPVRKVWLNNKAIVVKATFLAKPGVHNR